MLKNLLKSAIMASSLAQYTYAFAQTPPLSPPPPDAITARHATAFRALMQYANSRAVSYRIDVALSQLEGEISSQLISMSGGGVLVIAEVASQTNGAGEWFFTGTDHIYLVGPGTSPERSLLSSISRPSVASAFPDGWRRNSDQSVAFWFTVDRTGRLNRTTQPYGRLRSATLSLYSQLALDGYAARLARHEEIQILVEGLARQTNRSDIREQLRLLQANRSSALSQLEEINETLKRQAENARRVQGALGALDFLISSLDFAAAAREISRDLPESISEDVEKAQSGDEIRSTLRRAQDEIDDSVSRLRSIQPRLYEQLDSSESKTVEILRQNNIPTYNVPRLP